jgi:hypothetical protein
MLALEIDYGDRLPRFSETGILLAKKGILYAEKRMLLVKFQVNFSIYSQEGVVPYR